MTRHLLDSDAVIDCLAGVGTTQAFVRALLRDGHILCTSSVVIAEVFAGAHSSQYDTAARFLSLLQFLPDGPVAARQAGEWRFQFRRQGIQLTTTDCLIAAIALHHGTRLVTGNLRHFPMPELSLVPLPRS